MVQTVFFRLKYQHISHEQTGSPSSRKASFTAHRMGTRAVHSPPASTHNSDLCNSVWAVFGALHTPELRSNWPLGASQKFHPIHLLGCNHANTRDSNWLSDFAEKRCSMWHFRHQNNPSGMKSFSVRHAVGAKILLPKVKEKFARPSFSPNTILC